MKKSELTQITQIIEHLVAREVKKQLPKIIGEVFQNIAERSVVTERKNVSRSPEDSSPQKVDESKEEFKMSMKELFEGVTPSNVAANNDVSKPKHYSNNPMINQILNETTSDLRQRERLVGGAAFHGGYSPSIAVMSGFNPSQAQIPGQGMVDESEPSFLRNIPTMPGSNNFAPQIPISKPPVMIEGQESNHVPMSSLPQGISVLDVAKQTPLGSGVAQALTRNYSQMMKLIDKKKGKV